MIRLQLDLIEAILLAGQLAEDCDDFCRRSVNQVLGRLRARSMLVGTVEADGKFWVRGSFGVRGTGIGDNTAVQWENTELELAIKSNKLVRLEENQESVSAPLLRNIRMSEPLGPSFVFPFSKFRLTVGAAVVSFDSRTVECVEQTPEVVSTVWNSELYVSRPNTRRSKPQPSFGGHLSLRQREIVRLGKMGLTNQQIARELHLSESSIKQELTRVFRTYGISSRAELDGLPLELEDNSTGELVNQELNRV